MPEMIAMVTLADANAELTRLQARERQLASSLPEARARRDSAEDEHARAIQPAADPRRVEELTDTAHRAGTAVRGIERAIELTRTMIAEAERTVTEAESREADQRAITTTADATEAVRVLDAKWREIRGELLREAEEASALIRRAREAEAEADRKAGRRQSVVGQVADQIAREVPGALARLDALMTAARMA